jgi:hypothetical protein
MEVGQRPSWMKPSSERLTSPLTVGIDLQKRRTAQWLAAIYSHGGSQGFKSLTSIHAW